MAENEAEDRRLAEVEFVTSAYSPDEAWCDNETDTTTIRIHRRLDLQDPSTASGGAAETSGVQICLTLVMPTSYPTESPLQVEGTVVTNPRKKSDASNSTKTSEGNQKLRKVVYNVLPSLVSSCRAIANDHSGEEAVFIVLNHADDWIQEVWPDLCSQQLVSVDSGNDDGTKPKVSSVSDCSTAVWGRRLIYSHHIISTVKRRDIRDLVKHYNLTGFLRFGWPGIIIIEGMEDDCIAFYDSIRRWSWQYLVVRGEQQEQILLSVESRKPSDDDGRGNHSTLLDRHRKFSTFQEVGDLSIVARHCREAGLEALFQTSMKIYNGGDLDPTMAIKSSDEKEEPSGPQSTSSLYGALVHVDHMNNGKAYRKWLRKTSRETNCYLLIRQLQAIRTSSSDVNNGSKPTFIAVGIVAEDRANVAQFLKRWRTSRVDVDSSGKPCLERKMSILIEGIVASADPMLLIGMDSGISTTCDEEENNNFLRMASEQDLNVSTIDELLLSVSSMGGESWHQTLSNILSKIG